MKTLGIGRRGKFKISHGKKVFFWGRQPWVSHIVRIKKKKRDPFQRAY